MNFLDQILAADWITRLGWTLLHSLWEIALVTAVLALLLSLLRRGSANVRYLAACGGLTIMALVPIVTYGVLPDCQAPDITASANAAETTPKDIAVAAAEDITAAETGAKNTGFPVSGHPGEQTPVTSPSATSVASAAPQPAAEVRATDESQESSLQRIAAVLSPWMPWCVVAWFVGVFVVSVWNLGGWIAAQRLKRLGTNPVAEEISRRLSTLAQRSGISRSVAIMKSLMVEVPAVVGWLRPMVLLPAGILTGLTPAELDAILAHELAHIRRHDYLVNLLQTVVETLFFYHPGVWWLSRQIRAEREHCCDDMAIAVCGNKVDYASALAAVEAGRAAPKMVMAARKAGSSTLGRIRRVLGLAGNAPRRWRSSLAGGLITSTMIVALVTCFVVAGERTEGNASKTETASAKSVGDDDRIAQLIEQLGDDTFSRREAAQRELIRIGRPAEEALEAALGHADPEVAVRAKRCLAVIDPVKISPAKSLIAALGGDDDSTWTATVKALRTLGEPAVEDLVDALEDKDPRVRRGAVQALGEIKVAPVIDPLIKMLKDPEATIRRDAAAGLGNLASHDTKNLRPAQLVPALAAAVKDEDGNVRSTAAWALWQSNDPRAVEPLLGVLRDDHPAVGACAAEGLGYLRAKAAVEPLMAALRSEDKTLRRNAAAALGRIGDRRPLPLLSALATNDEHADVRAAAGKALRIIEHPQPRPSPIVWGKPVDGLQAGLRCTSGMAPYRYGQVVRYELLVRNLGQRDRTVQWTAFSGGWQPLVKDGEVLLHGGLSRFTGDINNMTRKISAGRPVSIKTMACTVRPSDWKKHDSPPSLRVAPGGYEVSTTFVSSRHDPKAKDVWQGALATGKVQLEVIRPALEIDAYTGDTAPADEATGAKRDEETPAGDAAWGKPVEGVQARLRVFRSGAYSPDTALKLLADVRNRGQRDLTVARAQQLCELEIDGRRYRWAGDIHVKSSWFPSGRQYEDIWIHLSAQWKCGDEPLVLKPGKHSVRVWFVATPTEKDAGEPVRFASNFVEIVPDDNLAVESLKKLGWRPMEKTNLIWDNHGRVSSIDIFAPSRDVPVTDAWLVPLKRMSELRMLYIGDTPITDAGLVHLKGLTKLKVLDLGRTQITDDGLAHLSGLTKLQRLELTGTKVTDAGLVHLERLTSLKSLFLNSTSVTQEGAEKLKRALPNVKVFLGEATNEVTGEPAEGAAFGPVIERTVAYREGFPSEAVAESGPMYLDLDTGAFAKFKALPDGKMIRQAGVDVYYEPSADGGGMRLNTSNLQVQPFSGEPGWNSSPAHVHRALMIGSPYHLANTEKSTLAIRTGDGGIGILQIVDFTKDRRGIRIRYKMLQPPKAGRSATAPATQPAEEGEWGQAVDGVQVRLRAKQSNWKQSAVVRLLADVRNQETRNLLIRAWGYSCEVEVDGRWCWAPPGGLGMMPALKPFLPGRQYDDIAIDLDHSWELKTSENARRPPGTEPEKLKLTPGKHTIRVAFTAMAAKNAPGKNVRAISNPVEIEVAADDEDPVDTSANVAGSPKVTVDLINAVGIQQRPSFWIGRERLTRQALLDRLGELRDKSPTLQVAIRHTASTEEKKLTALRQSLARLNIEDVSIGRHDLPHVFAYANAKYDGTIRGRVVDAHPTVPSPKYRVMLWKKSWDRQGGENPSLVVGAGEAFEFRTVGSGDYELRTREWRPNGRVVHFGADWTSIQTKAAVEDGKVTEVQVVFGKGDTGRWNDAYTWGEAVDGVIMRVTRAKFTIAPGEKIDLCVNIHNGGKIDREIVMNHESWQLEIDGQWLKESGGASSGRVISLLKAKQAQNNVDVWTWLGKNMTSAIKGLPPGKHTLRVARLLNGEGRSSKDPPQIRVVSQPVIIEVVAEDEGEGIGAADSTRVEPNDERAGATGAGTTIPPPVEATVEAVSTSRVIDAQGNPIAGAKVGFYENRTPRAEKPFSSTVTDESGEFPCPDRAPDKVRFSFYLVVSAPGFRTGEWLGHFLVDGRRIGARLPDTLRLDREVTVSGMVLGVDGKPLAGVPLAVDYFNQRGTWANPRRIQSDAQGRFKIDDLPPADIFIRYEKGQDDTLKGTGDAQFFISHVRAKDGQQVENVVVDLSKAKCVVEGQLVDHEGNGIEGASIKATFAASASRLVHYAWTETDQDGRYRIEGLPPHEFLVSAWAKNHFGGLGERVKLEIGETRTLRLLGYLPGHPAPEPKPDDPRWGKPAGDLRAAVELRPGREAYSMGEIVEVRPILRNTGEKTVTLIHDFSRAVELQVTDEAGKAQTFSYKGFSGVTVSKTYVLEPGHEVEMQGQIRLKLVGADSNENLIQKPGAPLAFALKCRPGGKYKLSYDLGDGLRTGEADLVVKDRIAAEITDAAEPDTGGRKDSARRTAVPSKTTVRGEVVDGDGRTLGLSTGSLRTSQELSCASAVMRARMVATEDNNYIIVYRITKLIYGRFPGKTLRQWDHFAGGEGATNFEEGKEVTLYVYRHYQRKDGTVICGIHFGALDEHDKKILEIVKSGTHLLPGKGPHDLVSYIRSSQRVVRAKLVKLDDVASHWDVSETVCSRSKSSSGTRVWKAAPKSEGTRENQPRITLSMTPWRLRAEAIVRAQAPQQTDLKQTEKQIKEEFNRLLSTDLKIGRDAILFLRPNDDPAEEALDSPAFVFPADPDDPGYLDQLAKKIRGIIERGEHEVLKL